MPGPLVDTHAHIYLANCPVVPGATHRPERSFTDVDFVRTLDENGVLFGVIAAASFMGSYNDYSLQALRAHRRLRATAIVEPNATLPELQAMDAAGIVGIRFSLRNYAGIPAAAAPGRGPRLACASLRRGRANRRTRTGFAERRR